VSQRKFFGCSSIFSDGSLHDGVIQLEEKCSDALGTYTPNPYLPFPIGQGSLPGPPTLLRLQSEQYNFPGGALSFSLHYANADGSLTDRIVNSAMSLRVTYYIVVEWRHPRYLPRSQNPNVMTGTGFAAALAFSQLQPS